MTTANMGDQSSLEAFVPLWIDGAAYHPPAARTFAVHNAKERRDVHHVVSADVASANKAADCAGRAQPGWENGFSAVKRRDILLRFADLIKSNLPKLVAVQMEETSCSEAWAAYGTSYAVDVIQEIAAHTTTALTGQLPPAGQQGTLNLVFQKAIGTVLLIAPWNAAAFLAARSLASMLAAGCSVVFKASELSPKTHHVLVELLIEAGIPSNVISVVQAGREDAPAVTEALIAHPAIRKIEFIGSASIGRIIASLAGKYLKPCLMELGGKNPAIILKDADLAAAAQRCIQSAFIHHGQVCISTERIIVERPVADALIESLKAVASHWPVEAAVNVQMAQASHDKLTDAHRKGATFVFGEPPGPLEGTSMKPAIVTNVDKAAAMYDEESFGPITTVIVAEDEDDAVRIANETKYGLEALLFTRDMAKAVKISQRIEAGRVCVNHAGLDATLPVRALKSSGWGTSHAGHGIKEFLVEKIMTMAFSSGKLGGLLG